MKTAESFKELYDIIAKLRSPGGCAWDREQTPSTLRGNLIEETYEFIEAIDENDSDHIAEELGDLFLVALMIGYIYEEGGKFTIADTLKNVNEKLIRRHPHVFGDVKVKDSDEIVNNWAAIKINVEGRKPKDSLLDEVKSGFPPMDRAHKLQKKAAKAGFDFSNIKDVTSKIEEELEEVKAESRNISENKNKLEEELGDLLFSVINLCRFFNVEPSVALRHTNGKFVERFKYVEKKMKESNQEMKKENVNLMDTFWNEAKNEEGDCNGKS